MLHSEIFSLMLSQKKYKVHIHNQLRSIVSETAAETLTITRNKCKYHPLLLSIGSSNGKSTHHMVKYINIRDLKDDSLLTFILDADAYDSANTRATEASDHSLPKNYQRDFIAKLKQ